MKIALIGHRGHWGYVLKDLARLPEVEVVAISGGGDPTEPMAEALRKYYSGSFALYEDYKQMLAEVECDLVMVDGPFHQHAEMCVECLKYDRHVFCEKPIALTLEDLEKIEIAYDNAAPGTRISSMVGLRTEPSFHAAYRAVSSGAIGKVQMINTRKSYKLGQRRDFFKKRETYGGTIPWVGSHALDWILWFSGSGFETVSAFHTDAENRDHGDLEMTCAVMSAWKTALSELPASTTGVPRPPPLTAMIRSGSPEPTALLKSPTASVRLSTLPVSERSNLLPTGGSSMTLSGAFLMVRRGSFPQKRPLN